MKCTKCDDTGVIETGNNDLPCDCSKGDTAIFNVGYETLTGAEIKSRNALRTTEALSATGLDQVSSLDGLLQAIEIMDQDILSIMQSSHYRGKSREVCKNDEEHRIVLHVLLKKMDTILNSDDCRMLPGTKNYLPRHVILTWFS